MDAEMKEIIDTLEDLIKDRESFISEDEKDDEENIFAHDAAMLKAAVRLLKEQEPRVMTIEKLVSLEKGTPVYFEETDGSDCYHGYTCFYGTSGQDIVSASYGTNASYYDMNEYGKSWRCWNTKPTNEQRREAKWE